MTRRWFALGLLVALLSGCFLAPAVDAVRQMGVTPADRMRLLPDRVKEFHEALHWGTGLDALALVTERSQVEMREELRSAARDERVNEGQVQFVDFDADAYKAQVEVLVKFLRSKDRVLAERLERQYWVFSVASGWQLEAREPIQPSERAQLR